MAGLQISESTVERTTEEAGARLKQQLDAAKTHWATISDKTQLASQCKQSADLFAQSATQMGCQ